MTTFKPTALIVRVHNITGLKYFHKTNLTGWRKDRYKGSGVHWRNHLRKHGNDTSIAWEQTFNDEAECRSFAEFFSEFYDIVKSKGWANQVPETGVGGQAKGVSGNVGPKNGMYGKKHTDKVKANNRAKRLAQVFTQETYDKISAANTGAGNGMYGTKRPEVSAYLKQTVKCPYCPKEGSPLSMNRWHFNRCKHRHLILNDK